MMSSPVFAEHLARYGPNRTLPGEFTLSDSQKYCQRLAQQHYENFVVASLLLPRQLKPHFYSIYAWCRWADDLADETNSPELSLELLDWWEAELQAMYADQPEQIVTIALRETVEQFSIPIEPFQKLIKAFRQDQTQTRYETFEQLLGYCRHSANPVGELVLYLGKAHDPQLVELSDSICTGLQLANFWQDMNRDFQRGRLYMPREVQQQHEVTEADFAKGEVTANLRRMLESEVERAEEYLRAGLPLVELVPAALKLEIELFARGGLAICHAIRQSGFDVWTRRPKVSKTAQLQLLAGCWWKGQLARLRGQSV